MHQTNKTRRLCVFGSFWNPSRIRFIKKFAMWNSIQNGKVVILGEHIPNKKTLIKQKEMPIT